MNTRIAKKVHLAMLYGTERKRVAKKSYYFRQPYSIEQQRKAMKRLNLTDYVLFYVDKSL